MICNNCKYFIGSGIDDNDEYGPMNKLFKKYFYKPINIYSTDEIWLMIKNDKDYNDKILKKDFLEWLSNQEQHQIQTIKYKPTMYPPIIAGPYSYQIDIMFLKQFAQLNNRFDSILNIVEITTKKAYSYPLKYKSSSDVFDEFIKFYNTIDKKLNLLEMDAGNEFNKIIKFCKDNDIKIVIFNGIKNSMSIVERFNRTLRDFIDKNCKDGIWINKLDEIIKLYNNKNHSSINATPNEFEKNPNKQDYYRKLLIGKLALYQVELSKFKVGDRVRVYKNKGFFEKGGSHFSKTIHTITKIKGFSVFIDNNNDKKYKVYQLMKIDKSISPPEKIDDKDLEKLEQEKKNYKIALKLSKEQITRKNVHDVNIDLQNNLNDETLGRGKRIKKEIERLKY